MAVAEDEIRFATEVQHSFSEFASIVTTIIDEERQSPDSIEVQNDKIIDATLRHALLYPLKYEAPEIERKIRSKLDEDADFAGSLQLPQLKIMTEKLVGTLDRKVFEQVLPYIASSMSWYFWEIGSDNIAKVVGQLGNEFMAGTEIRSFNNWSIDLINGDITIEDFLQNIESELGDLNHVQTETTDKIVASLLPGNLSGVLMKLPPGARRALMISRIKNWENISKGSQLFIKDPNKALLKLNAITLDIAMQATHSIGDILGQNHWLVKGSFAGGIKRYDSMNQILDDPGAPIEKAIEVGAESILLPYTYHSYFSFIAAFDEKVRELANSKQSELSECFSLVSLVGRLANDQIGAITRPESARRLILQGYKMSESSIFSLYPRSAVRMLYTISKRSPKALHSRIPQLAELINYYEDVHHDIPMLLKDAGKEAEFSATLNAGMFDGMGSKSAWYRLLQNMKYVTKTYNVAFQNLEKFAGQLDDEISGDRYYNMIMAFPKWMIDDVYLARLDFDKWETPILES